MGIQQIKYISNPEIPRLIFDQAMENPNLEPDTAALVADTLGEPDQMPAINKSLSENVTVNRYEQKLIFSGIPVT